MRYIIILILIIVVLAGTTEANERGIFGTEPPKDVLEAPFYPEAVFIRTMSSLDPFYETVLYVVPDPVGDVKNYFLRKLPHTRVVQYREEGEWVWTFLLKDWILLPDKPSRDDLTILDKSPNVQVKKFQSELYEPLIELFRSKPDALEEFEALENARTVIRYTYQKIEENIAFKKIIGKWKHVDRDLHDYYGSIFQFKPDSTYKFTLTADNIAFLAKELSSAKQFKDKSPEDIHKFIEGHNPEKGRFSIMRNIIIMETDMPVVGEKEKSGLIEVGSFFFSLRLINTPRLTFIRLSSE